MKILIGIFVVVVGGVLWWASPQRVIGLNPATMTVPKDGTAVLTAQLMYKGWFKSALKPISGTIKAKATNTIVVVNPSSVTTTSAGGRSASFSVTGIASGTGQVFINGTSRKGSHDTAKLAVTVP